MNYNKTISMEKPKNEWEDIYGETEITFGPGNEVKITERKSGEVTKRAEEQPPETAFEKLNDVEKKRVLAEIKKFEENAHGYFPKEIEKERIKIMKELSEKMLAERK